METSCPASSLELASRSGQQRLPFCRPHIPLPAPADAQFQRQWIWRGTPGFSACFSGRPASSPGAAEPDAGVRQQKVIRLGQGRDRQLFQTAVAGAPRPEPGCRRHQMERCARAAPGPRRTRYCQCATAAASYSRNCVREALVKKSHQPLPRRPGGGRTAGPGWSGT